MGKLVGSIPRLSIRLAPRRARFCRSHDLFVGRDNHPSLDKLPH
jgi:hypothetical protein